MQTLGISDSTPKSENRFKSLFWPTIRHDGDVEHLAHQGFWICLLVAGFTLVASVILGNLSYGLFESAFFFLAAIGVRQLSRVAAVSAFSAYLLSSLVMTRYGGHALGIGRIIFLALLLANIRAAWLSARWVATRVEPPPLRLNETFWDKVTDQMPIYLWPKTRILFYVVAAMELSLLLMSLFAPINPQL